MSKQDYCTDGSEDAAGHARERGGHEAKSSLQHEATGFMANVLILRKTKCCTWHYYTLIASEILVPEHR